MCLAVPGKIIGLHADPAELFHLATVDFCGMVKNDVCVDTVPEARVGDYVVVHAGVAISVMNADEAAATIADLERMTDYRDTILDPDGKPQP